MAQPNDWSMRAGGRTEAQEFRYGQVGFNTKQETKKEIIRNACPAGCGVASKTSGSGTSKPSIPPRPVPVSVLLASWPPFAGGTCVILI